MAITRNHDECIVERMRKDSEYARLSFNKVVELIVDGEPETARVMLRNLVNATVGFEEFARRTEKDPEADPPAH
jgi:hypothetical protein